MEFIRIDGRTENQIRPYSVEYGLIQESTSVGSSRWQQGSSEIIVSIHGPSQPRYCRHEQNNQISVDLSIHRLGSSDNQKKSNTSMEKFLQQSLLSCIDATREEYQRTLLVFKVKVIKDDGSLYGHMFNACIVALLDSGICMTSTPLASQISYSKGNNCFLLDPTRNEEDSSSSSILMITMPSAINGCDVISSFRTMGRIECQNFGLVCDLSIKCCQNQRNFIRELFNNKESL